MRYLSVVIHIELVAIFIGQPLPRQPKPCVYANALVGNCNAVVLRNRLVGNSQTFLGKSVNAACARSVETCSEILVILNPRINRAATWQSRITAYLGERLSIL